MRVALMAAAAENNVIGGDNKLLWQLPNDLQYFKRVTMGKPLIMGRKTFDSIGRPLPGRTNIVVTGQTDWQVRGVEIVHSIDDALRRAQDLSLIDGVEEVMVIGGEQIYKQILPSAQRLYLTRVHAQFEGDAYFPVLDEHDWKEVEREDFQSDASNPFDYSFIVLDRVT